MFIVCHINQISLATCYITHIQFAGAPVLITAYRTPRGNLSVPAKARLLTCTKGSLCASLSLFDFLYMCQVLHGQIFLFMCRHNSCQGYGKELLTKIVYFWIQYNPLAISKCKANKPPQHSSIVW